MPRSRRNLQGIGCSALALAGCADDARWGLALSQRRQRCHPEPSPQWSSERHDDQPMQVDFRKHDE